MPTSSQPLSSAALRPLRYETSFSASFVDAPYANPLHPDVPEDEYVALRERDRVSRRREIALLQYVVTQPEPHVIHMTNQLPGPLATVVTARLDRGPDGPLAVGTLASIRLRFLAALAIVAIGAFINMGFVRESPRMTGPDLVWICFMLLLAAPSVAAEEHRRLLVFRRLEAEVGRPMTALEITHPSSSLHWHLTRLLVRLTWSSLRLSRAHHPLPPPH